MKKFKVEVPVEYVMGHLRYGHYEVELEAESIDAAKKYLQTEDGQDYIIENGDLEIDDYSVEDAGSLDMTMMHIEEVWLWKEK